MLGGSNISSSDNYLGGRVANTLTGLLDFAPVVGDAVGVGDTITSYRQGDIPSTVINAAATGIGVLPLVGGPASKAVKAGGNRVRSALRGIAAGHASPHEFEKFSMNNIGTGEGAQVFGHGLYFGENPKVIDEYFNAFNEPVLRFKERNVDTPYTGELRDRFADVYRSLIDMDGARSWKENVLDRASDQGLNVDEIDDKLNVLFKNIFEQSETPRDFAAIDFDSLGIDPNEIYDAAGNQFGSQPLLLDNILGGISQAKTMNELQYVVEGFSPQEMRLYKDLVEPELAELSNSASRYDVNLNVEPEELLDWDRPLTEQPRALNAIKQLYLDDMKRIDANSLAGEPKLSELYTSVDDVSMSDLGLFDTSKGSQAYNTIASSNMGRGAEELSRKLKERGIKGIKYFDGMSRNTGEGTRNYVMFDESLIDTKRVNDKLTDSWMNPEARMQRAQDLGFEEDIYYKGMYPYDYTKESGDYRGPEITEINRPSEFPAFNKGEEGVDIAGFLTKDREVANRFAGYSGGGAVYPLRYRKGEVYTIDANGRNAGELQFGESGKEFREAVRSGNYDTIEILNTADEGDITIATQPKNIRSINAEFDPTKADSADLLSSISPTQSSLRNIA
jgi:hypothetical protein